MCSGLARAKGENNDDASWLPLVSLRQKRKSRRLSSKSFGSFSSWFGGDAIYIIRIYIENNK